MPNGQLQSDFERYSETFPTRIQQVAAELSGRQRVLVALVVLDRLSIDFVLLLIEFRFQFFHNCHVGKRDHNAAYAIVQRTVGH